MQSLGDLPDIGDPFDMEFVRRPIVISDRDNAFEAYARARISKEPAPPEVWEARTGTGDALWWSKAKLSVRAFQERNRPALEIWRVGSERPDAVYHQPGELTVETALPLVQELRVHSAMAVLAGSRMEEQGDMDQAWTWYRAILRSSRLVGRHGGLVERRYGAYMHELAARRIVRWASDRRVKAGMLHRALDQALAVDSLTPPLSNALKLDYLIILRDLEEMKLLPRDIPLPGGKDGFLENVVPPWRVAVRREIQQFRFRSLNEPERSRRAIRLIFANWLAQVDKPAAARAPFAIRGRVLIYATDSSAPPEARAVTPEILSRYIDETLLAKWILASDDPEMSGFGFVSCEGAGIFARERRRRSALLVKLAAELYRREHGTPPPNAGELVGGYLQDLPEGVAPGDPIPGALE
jgi:hypothetical protein